MLAALAVALHLPDGLLDQGQARRVTQRVRVEVDGALGQAHHLGIASERGTVDEVLHVAIGADRHPVGGHNRRAHEKQQGKDVLTHDSPRWPVRLARPARSHLA